MIRSGYQPAPDHDPRAGKNPPPSSGSGVSGRHGSVCVEMNAGGNYIRLIHIIARIEVLKMQVEGMKAENEQRKVRGDSMAYGDEAFYKLSYEMDALSKETAQMYQAWEMSNQKDGGAE